MNRTVALKIPQAHLIEDHEDVERFYTEARVAAQLRHPGIVTLHEVMVIDDLPILVHDFVTGISLGELCAARRLTPRAAAGLIAKVADALAYAHSMGAIHRDIKPANVMLDPSCTARRTPRAKSGSGWPGEPRIVDFGLAFLKQDDAELARRDGIVGTPAYMSPEQAIGRSGDNSVDHRTDIYSLGVVLFELLTGALPLAGNAQPDPPRPRPWQAAGPSIAQSSGLARPRQHLPQGHGQGAATVAMPRPASWPTTCATSSRGSRSGPGRSADGSGSSAVPSGVPPRRHSG